MSGFLCVFVESSNPAENTINTKQTLPVQIRAVDTRDLDLTKRERRRGEAQVCDPLIGLYGSLMPPEGINQSPCCLCNRRRIKSVRLPPCVPVISPGSRQCVRCAQRPQCGSVVRVASNSSCYWWTPAGLRPTPFSKCSAQVWSCHHLAKDETANT